MQKNLYQVQQLTVKYHFSFWTLSDQNMKTGCHAIIFLKRLNIIPRGYIILDRTLKNYEKILSPRKLDKKAGFML